LRLLHKGTLDRAFPYCLSLRTVEIHEYNQLLLRETDCAQVTTLTLGTDTAWVDEDVEVLCTFGSLRRLTLSAPPNPSYSNDRLPETKTEVLFPYLHRLTLLGQPVWHIIDLMKAPVLKDVEFDKIIAFDIFKSAPFASVIETIYIMDYNGDTCMSNSVLSEWVVGLLAFLPRLQRIRLSKHVHKKLGSDVLQFQKRGIHLEVF
jgi:hypothetical protein